MEYHLPVLAKQSIEEMSIKSDGIYVDATFGGGGHSRLILEQLGPEGRLFCFDQDPDARENLWEDERLTFFPANFRYIERFLKMEGVRKVDGILADLGVSSHQFDTAERGFSFRFDAKLDMRMSQSGEVTAATVLNTYSESELQKMFSSYGEVRNSKTLAQAIVAARNSRALETIQDLSGILDSVGRGPKNRYYAQVFQAIRMEVNEEVAVLEDLLSASVNVLKEKGRLVVISYHSIEDRLVKKLMKTGNVDGSVEKDFYGNIYRPFKLISKKAIIPDDAEIKENPRARSAKMRVGERTADQALEK